MPPVHLCLPTSHMVGTPRVARAHDLVAKDDTQKVQCVGVASDILHNAFARVHCGNREFDFTRWAFLFS